MPLRTLALVDASVPETADLAEAVAALFAAQVPALAVLDAERHVVGVFSEEDLLRAVFPGWLGEVRHTAFLQDDTRTLDERARSVRSRPVREFARRVEALQADDSQFHAGPDAQLRQHPTSGQYRWHRYRPLLLAGSGR